ncbi:TonB-dependent receptor [Solilutibacter silvestris]|uniref:TonB-Xanth-Caul: TonB-dependent receptor n=1 Tax=Solilutibacter silvestris TaxID=1645665 RepID=A0A2K1Q3G8_9GAMM|nr:TonB-dependent receptor [Lysobacter silvestris]PNS09497.1 TonB-Xanth-Caul: TonB-dependent receptor [Lysobacter silvestris]
MSAKLGVIITGALVLPLISTSAIAADLVGHIEIPRGKHPASGVEVRLRETGATTMADANGNYTFTGLKAAMYTLDVLTDGKVSASKTVRVGDGVTRADLNFDRNAGEFDRVVVLAQRTTTAIARATQQEAPNLVNLTTAAEIRKLPDVNAAEAVRRVPGISLETDTGEGRFINIRGLDSDLNSTTFGGLRLPPSNNASPFGGGRAVAMDAIPAGFIGALTVTKTNIPEQDAEALGGTIEITPKTAPRNARAFVEGHIGTGREDQRGDGITDFSVTAGGRFGSGSHDDKAIQAYSDHPFSIVATLAYYENKRSVDDIEAGYVDNQPTIPDKAFAAFEQRYYLYHRKRHGYGLDFGYQPDADNQYYIRGFDAGYTETVNRQRLLYNFDGTPMVDPANRNGLIDTTASGGFDKTLRDEREHIDNKVFALGGSNRIGDNTLDYRVGYTRGSFNKPYDYNSDFNYPAPNGVVTYDNTTDPNFPRFSTTGATPLNSANYALASVVNSTQDIRDRESSYNVNYKIPMQLSGFADENIKFGLNVRLRDRTASGTQNSYANTPSMPLTSAIYGPDIIFYDGHYQNGPQIDMNAIRGLVNGLQPSVSTNNTVNGLLQYAKDKEDVYAGYAQYQFGFGKLSFITGVRIEDTHATYGANGVSTSKDASGNTVINAVVPVSSSTSYLNFFPSIQARYEIRDDLILRAAFSSTIARPGFNEVSAALNVNPGAGLVVQGNPDLKPTTAQSFDLSIEKYLNDGGIASFGLFDKELGNYIASVTTTKVLPNDGLFAGFLGPAHVITYDNIASARAWGFEANYEQRFKRLPGWLNGFGLGFNWTWVDSTFAIRPGENSPLPSTSRNTINAAAFYERNGLMLHLGYYYVSRNLFGIGGSAATDVYSEARTSLDFGSSYSFNKNLSVYFNAKNLGNTKLKFTEGTANRPIQREFYGRTYQLGVSFDY